MSRIILLGVDPGVHTGLSEWNRNAKCFISIKTVSIHNALLRIHDMRKLIEVYMEDARLRSGYFGSRGNHNHQGVGSIKRDCGIIESACIDWEIPIHLIPPQAQKGLTKWDAERFKKVTEWSGRTSVHARDASLLVWKR